MARKPTPTAILRARGGYRKDRHGERADVDLVPSAPACPEWIADPLARRQWETIAPMLAECGVMTDRFTLALSLLVTAIARWLTFVQIVDRDGAVMESGVVRVAHYAEAKASERVLTLLREFGMTPSSLPSLRLPAAKPTTPNTSMLVDGPKVLKIAD